MTRINFLFWNINNQSASFEDDLSELIKSEGVDVLILAENKNIVPSGSLKNLGYKSVELKLGNKAAKWVQILYKKNEDYEITHHTEYTEVEDDEISGKGKTVNRIQVFKIKGKVKETYFACIHFPSKLYHDEISHLQIVPFYKEKVETLTLKSDRLFIVGDFNMNPFDLGMVEPSGFYAHNNRNLIESDRHQRHLAMRTLYYNPCWTLLGDYINGNSHSQSNRSGGTFYFEKEKSRKIYWHLIDQIIMRKSLIDEFNSEHLKVLENEELIKEVKGSKEKNKNKIDHFPLKFSFNLT